MIGQWFKKAVLYGAEALVAVVLVLVFFLACMTLLQMSFPKGAGLRDLMGSSPRSGDASPAPRFTFDRNGELRPSGPKTIAHLVDVRERVKDKKSTRIDWGDSEAGAPLEERHAVQTFARSSAVIAFEGLGEVALRENSLIVLGAAVSEEETKRGDVVLLVTSGAVRGIIGGKSGSGRDLRVVTASGEAKIREAAASTDFQVSVNGDRSSTFAVYKGATEITAAGRTVRIGPNQAVTVAPGAAPGDPVALPREPEPASPPANATIPFRTVSPRVTLTWQPISEASGYHVQLAHDPGFKDLVADVRVSTAALDHGGLAAGAYFWRVSAMKKYVEGATSVPRRLTVVEDRVPPFLEVRFPEQPVQGATVVVSGDAEPGADVFVGSARIATDAAGHFSREVELAPGWNVVVVEAIDAAGNVAYQSQRLMLGELLRARVQ